MKLRNKSLEFYKSLLVRRNLHFFEEGYELQKKKLESFKEPKDFTERSYFQYLCQMQSKTFVLKSAQNLIAIPLIVFYLIKRYKKFESSSDNLEKSAVFVREGIDKSLIPDSLISEFTKICESPMNADMFLDKHDKTFLIRYLAKYLKSPFFVLKCLIKLGCYSFVINKELPDAIITHIEYSFACSFLTGYCESKKVEHINVMHGEKLFDIRDSFVYFDRFYVWDIHYVELLSELRAEKTQFFVEVPSYLRINSIKKAEYPYEITYYLAGEDEATMRTLARHLSKTNISKEKICLRYHPRYSNKALIKDIFSEFEIQDPIDVTIKESLERTNYVVSVYSTVLYQAYLDGKKIMIDNVTSKHRFDVLKALKYIMIKKEHVLLSSLMR